MEVLEKFGYVKTLRPEQRFGFIKSDTVDYYCINLINLIVGARVIDARESSSYTFLLRCK